VPAEETAVNAPAQGLALLEDEMERQSLIPLWKVYERVVTQAPSLDAPSHHWRWRDLERAVKLTTELVHGKDADHRVLVLKHPKYAPRVATANNILAAVQCVLAGERTNPHRHTPAAVRLVLEGSGGGTFVDGVRCEMRSGDFIVTPNWTWHCHDNDSGVPVTWVDILDVPFVRAANNVFGDMGPVTAYPEVPPGSQFRFPWTETVARLAAAPAKDGVRSVRFTNPRDGGPVIPTLEAGVVEIAAGRSTPPARTSASQLCVVVEGSGGSRVGDARHEWSARDIFTVPEWHWTEHRAAGERARLLVVDDRNFRRILGLYREEIQ
jgi:gentisate 1,2-dioxygenase